MSSALICNTATHVHDFRDDLELSIYVLLWVTLMYSDPSNQDAVGAFLVNVLDPQPIGGTGGSCKADFLQGQTFLKQVNFPGRPKLYKLISELAHLFAVRYETVPTDKERTMAEQCRSHAVKSPVLWDLYYTHRVYLFDTRKSQLWDHSATIALFNDALSDCSQWPYSDSAVKQVFAPRPVSEAVVKTCWHTTAEGLLNKSAIA